MKVHILVPDAEGKVQPKSPRLCLLRQDQLASLTINVDHSLITCVDCMRVACTSDSSIDPDGIFAKAFVQMLEALLNFSKNAVNDSPDMWTRVQDAIDKGLEVAKKAEWDVKQAE